METGAGRCWSLNRGSARAQLFWEEFCKTRARGFLSCKWETEKTFTWVKLSSPWSSPWILLCAWNPNSTVWDQVSVYCKISLCVPELRNFMSSYLPLPLTAHCQCCLSQVSILGHFWDGYVTSHLIGDSILLQCTVCVLILGLGNRQCKERAA